VHLVGFIIRIYHDARSSECQMSKPVNYVHIYLNRSNVKRYVEHIHLTYDFAD